MKRVGKNKRRTTQLKPKQSKGHTFFGTSVSTRQNKRINITESDKTQGGSFHDGMRHALRPCEHDINTATLWSRTCAETQRIRRELGPITSGYPGAGAEAAAQWIVHALLRCEQTSGQTRRLTSSEVTPAVRRPGPR